MMMMMMREREELSGIEIIMKGERQEKMEEKMKENDRTRVDHTAEPSSEGHVNLMY